MTISRRVTKKNIAFIRQFAPKVKLGELIYIDSTNSYVMDNTKES